MRQPAPAANDLSVEEFLLYPTPEGKAELVRGELRMSPPTGGRHGVVQMAILMRLANFVESRGLGRVFVDAGFELVALPRTVRAPDAAFVRGDRIHAGDIGPAFLRMPPDLAVEVLSPSETPKRLQEKLDDYRVAGVALVWVIDPRRRTVMIVSRDAPTRWLSEDDVLDGGSVVLGFSCPVRELFIGLAVG